MVGVAMPPLRRGAGLVLVAVAVLSMGTGAAEDHPLVHRPGLRFAGDVPGDVRALARATWIRFTDALPARWTCLPPVTVTGAWTLADRASYDPDRRVVTVRLPGTAPNLAATLVHEFAHHVEFTCPQQLSVRPRFLGAQGFGPGTPWFTGATWEATPSEQFAEAAVQVVLGGPNHPMMVISPQALRAIRDWGRGR
jgi:hypothetical protein